MRGGDHREVQIVEEPPAAASIGLQSCTRRSKENPRAAERSPRNNPDYLRITCDGNLNKISSSESLALREGRRLLIRRI